MILKSIIKSYIIKYYFIFFSRFGKNMLRQTDRQESDPKWFHWYLLTLVLVVRKPQTYNEALVFTI